MLRMVLSYLAIALYLRDAILTGSPFSKITTLQVTENTLVLSYQNDPVISL
ncbi:hypothetical protein JCM19235_5625 [Vibrio maritimus]|uniref:Uncharacterized protein n=1 Tax=Vibrio maritimus TaxID=990268 RepID=A0A090RP88_9VIBR|nr:hypothetical protein JCM19235_5625 [Vibrio maritimus]